MGYRPLLMFHLTRQTIILERVSLLVVSFNHQQRLLFCAHKRLNCTRITKNPLVVRQWNVAVIALISCYWKIVTLYVTNKSITEFEMVITIWFLFFLAWRKVATKMGSCFQQSKYNNCTIIHFLYELIEVIFVKVLKGQ